jgi:hypothetical protein
MPDDAAPAHGGPASSDRLTRFQEEVGALRVSGGAANPERLGGRIGIAIMVVAAVGGVLCWYGAYTAGAFEEIQRLIIAGGLFVGLGVVGAVIWVRNSFTRYLRYWLVRLIYEQREQTEQLVADHHDQMERLIAALKER